MATNDLYVLALEIEHYMRISAVEIACTGPGVVEITGKNRQGKTSVLSAIWAAIGGADHEPEEPIRDGADSGSVKLLIGKDQKHPEYEVTKTFRYKADGSAVVATLKVRNLDGMMPAKPQQLLSSWLQSVTIDPMRFLAEPKKQGEILRKIAGLDTAAIDNQRLAAFTERTEVNRDLKRIKSQVEGMPAEEKLPERIDVTKALAELAAAQRKVQEANEQKREIEYAQREVDDCAATVEAIKERIEKLQDDLSVAEEDLAEHKAILAKVNEGPLITVPDMEGLRNRLAEADKVNRRHEAIKAANATRRISVKELEATDAKANELTARIDELDEAKAAAIAACKMPLKGLSIDDDGNVTFKGVPIAQASRAEQIEVAVAIAMAQSPRLKVLMIRDGSLLDEETMARVQAFARKHKLQIWVETVRAATDQAIEIVDGRLAEEAA